MKYTLPSLMILSVLLPAAPVWGQAEHAIDFDMRVDRAIDAAASRLWRDHKGDHWAEDTPGSAPRDYGGRTALCVYALLSAGGSYQSERMIRTIDWLTRTETKSVYARSFRLLALGQLPAKAAGEPIRRRIADDLKWLLAAARPDGAYDYLPSGADDDSWDNSNTHIAQLAVWTAAQRGYAVPAEYWRRARQHWLRTQTGQGGWSYWSARKRAYGSMTAAGLASLFICYDELSIDAVIRSADAQEYRPIEEALAWLGRNFSPWENPGRGPQYYHYYLWAVERVGRASGYAYLGSHDWYRAAGAELLRTQSRDGGWGDLIDTCFALAFLGQGRHPILFSKLKYDGTWNPRPRDMANLSRWIGYRFERPVRWQVVDIASPVRQWRNAPILYISGASAPKFSDRQIAKLRRYVDGGGLIFSEAAAGSPAFNVAMRKVYARIFPDRPLEPIDPSHPIFSTHRPLEHPIRLSGVSNGVRLLAIHSPADLSKAWQLRDTKRRGDTFQLAANVYFHATDFGTFGRRSLPLATEAPQPGEGEPPKRTIRIARLTHEGNPNPEPAAYGRLADLMASRYGVRLQISEPMAIADLPAKGYPIALMTGTEAFTLRPADRRALRAFIDAGGLLVADATGGSDAFDRAAREQLLTLLSDVYPKVGRLSAASEIYKLPGMAIDKVTYRRAARSLYGEDRSGRLQVVSVDGHPAIIYSRDDLTAGLVGYHGHNLRGYTPRSALEIMRNLILYAGGRPKPDKGVLQGSIDVQWGPADL